LEFHDPWRFLVLALSLSFINKEKQKGRIMHIVYMLTFKQRLKNNTPPYYYIGSKSKCEFYDNTIYDSNKKSYYGSSGSKIFLEALTHELPVASILYVSEDYNDCLQEERNHHIKNNVVLSSDYFNCAIATVNNYSNPDYITAKQIITGKICRIHKNNFNEDWVGVSSGKSWYNNGKENKLFENEEKTPNGWKKGRIGDFSRNSKNFLKNISQEELSKKMVEARTKNGNYSAHNKGVKGVYKHSEESKEKMKKSRSKRKTNGMENKIIINDGFQNKVIHKDLPIPSGFTKGRLFKKKTQDS
jgi:hypothetical protein